MAANWKAFELPQLPSGVETAVTTLNTIADTVVTILELIKTAIQLLSNIELLNLSVAQALIKAALAAIEDAIKALLEGTGVYLLFVPVQKKVVIPAIVTEALNSTGLRSGLHKLAGLPVVSASSTVIDSFSGTPHADFANSLSSATGGNAGFVKQVMQSLDDAGDANRPQLTTEYVAGAYIVAGSDDFLSLINAITAFTGLIAPRQPASALDVPGEPVPQNLRVKVVAGSGDDCTCYLEWDPQLPLVNIPTLGMSALVTQVAILRSTDPSMLTRSTVQEIFGPGTLTAGKKVGVGKNTTEVRAVLDYSGVDLKSSYVDEGLEKDTAYYYAVAFNYKGGDATDLASGGGREAGFRSLSNVVKVYATPRAARSASGTPPDWIRTPRAIDLLPDVGDLINRLLLVLQQLGGFTVGFGDMLKGYIKYLEQEITAYAEMAEYFARSIQTLTNLMSLKLNAGVYITSFSGQGGNAFLMKDLTEALSTGNTDPNRPPFDGDEFVTGVVILAAGPSAAAVAPVQKLLGELFGNVGTEKSVIQKALEAIDVAVTEAEAKLLNDEFRVQASVVVSSAAPLSGSGGDTATSPVAETPRSPPPIGEDDDGTKDLNCPPELVPAIQLGDDFSII